MIEKVHKMIKEQDKMTDKHKKMIVIDEKLINFSNNLSTNQFNLFINFINEYITENDFEKIQNSYAMKNNVIKIATNKKEEWIDTLYADEISKINFIMNNSSLIEEIGGFKILISGPTGTGKTTIVNKLIEMNKNIKYEKVNFTSLVSSKMGQTQLNLMMLSDRLNGSNEKTIIFLDELDSFVTNRNNSDLGEHTRIIASFLKFMDNLSFNIIFISATNFEDHIDKAILRRFVIQVKTDWINIDKAIKYLSSNNFIFSTQKINFLKKHIVEEFNKFSLSDIKSFLNNYKIESEMSESKYIENWLFFLKSFKSKFLIINDEKLSDREKTKLTSIKWWN